MSGDGLRKEYFEWLCNFVYDDEHTSRGLSYNKMFSFLFDTPFHWTMTMDENRAVDGIDLRYRYGRERGIADPIVASYLDDRDCSMLEMMVALALRMENQIMENPDVGNRVGQWFWDMIVSLDINMPDSRFDYGRAERRIEILETRSYRANGEGGLFTISTPTKDMRTTEIWYQMCYYIDEIFGNLFGE